MAITNQQIIKAVQAIIEERTSLTKMNNGFGVTMYETDVYVEHDDQLTDQQVSAIMEATSEEEAQQLVYDALHDYEIDCTNNEQDYVLSIIRDNWDWETYGAYEEHEEFIIEYVQEHIYFNFPYDQYMQTTVNMNIRVDSGDGDYDYTLNNFAHGHYSTIDEEGIDSESSLLWLAEQQGYTKEELEAATINYMEEGEEPTSKLLKSIIVESENVTSHMNALTFFVKMTLQDYITFIDNKHDLLLSKNVSCGLLDSWQGAGGLLEIELEKDITIPFDMAYLYADGTSGYGADEIYGLFDKHWTDNAVSFK